MAALDRLHGIGRPPDRRLRDLAGMGVAGRLAGDRPETKPLVGVEARRFQPAVVENQPLALRRTPGRARRRRRRGAPRRRRRGPARGRGRRGRGWIGIGRTSGISGEGTAACSLDSASTAPMHPAAPVIRLARFLSIYAAKVSRRHRYAANTRESVHAPESTTPQTGAIVERDALKRGDGRMSFKWANVVGSVAVIAAAAAAASTAIAADASGIAISVTQSTNVGRGSGQVVLHEDAPVFMGDVIKTNQVGDAQIRLSDDTLLVVGPNSLMTIDRFVLSTPDTAKQVTLNAVRGAFRFISGNSKHDAYTVDDADRDDRLPRHPRRFHGAAGRHPDGRARGRGRHVRAEQPQQLPALGQRLWRCRFGAEYADQANRQEGRTRPDPDDRIPVRNRSAAPGLAIPDRHHRLRHPRLDDAGRPDSRGSEPHRAADQQERIADYHGIDAVAPAPAAASGATATAPTAATTAATATATAAAATAAVHQYGRLLTRSSAMSWLCVGSSAVAEPGGFAAPPCLRKRERVS